MYLYVYLTYFTKINKTNVQVQTQPGQLKTKVSG